MSPDIESGCHYIIGNHKGKTVIDLSGEDDKSIIGYPCNGGPNQQWEPIRINDGWIIKNVKTGHYLGYDGQACDGTNLVATEQPVVWDIWHDTVDPSAYRISAPNTNQDVDLSNHGDPSPGTRVATWGRWEGMNQVWVFAKV